MNHSIAGFVSSLGENDHEIYPAPCISIHLQRPLGAHLGFN